LPREAWLSRVIQSQEVQIPSDICRVIGTPAA
jgi:hypothetical protein